MTYLLLLFIFLLHDDFPLKQITLRLTDLSKRYNPELRASYSVASKSQEAEYFLPHSWQRRSDIHHKAINMAISRDLGGVAANNGENHSKFLKQLCHCLCLSMGEYTLKHALYILYRVGCKVIFII